MKLNDVLDEHDEERDRLNDLLPLEKATAIGTTLELMEMVVEEDIAPEKIARRLSEAVFGMIVQFSDESHEDLVANLKIVKDLWPEPYKLLHEYAKDELHEMLKRTEDKS